MASEALPNTAVEGKTSDAADLLSEGAPAGARDALRDALAELTVKDSSATADQILQLESDDERLVHLAGSIKRLKELPLAPLAHALQSCIKADPDPKAAVEAFARAASPSKADRLRLLASLVGDPGKLRGTIQPPIIELKNMSDNAFKQPRATPPAVYVIRQDNAGGEVHDPESDSLTKGRPAAERMVGLEWLAAVIVEENGSLCKVYGRESHPLGQAFERTVSAVWGQNFARLVPPYLKLHAGPWEISHPPVEAGHEIRVSTTDISGEGEVRMISPGDAAYLVMPEDTSKSHAVGRIARLTRAGAAELILTFDRWASIDPPATLDPGGPDPSIEVESDQNPGNET